MLRDLMKKFLEKAKASPEGKKIITMYDHTFQFETGGKEDFVLTIKKGKVAVKKGKVPKYDYLTVSIVETTPATIEKVLKGKMTPADAFEGPMWFKGAWCKRRFHVWLTRLFRIGQEASRVSVFDVPASKK